MSFLILFLCHLLDRVPTDMLATAHTAGDREGLLDR